MDTIINGFPVTFNHTPIEEKYFYTVLYGDNNVRDFRTFKELCSWTRSNRELSPRVEKKIVGTLSKNRTNNQLKERA